MRKQFRRQDGEAARRDILLFVAEFWSKKKYAPSIREIGEATGISSTSVVYYHIGVLILDGILEEDIGVKRSIRFKGMKIVIPKGYLHG